ncbi:transducin family protein / WD-40 repeat family protein [Striga asiatica]|uniref:Transducin family protein / WD-40 repeat family protein n=1 Tax=Striga asiatica TaxID=4170 RepID=A0A5A7QGS6_STRAF|nr:transducin family protein / WD-40 repeat family protein [Striga asiatica]
MSSLSRELVFLILQFLDEEKFKETVHKLEQESGFFFNMKYFEDEIHNGNWDEVERYLSGFTKVDDNRYSMKIFFEIRKQKYLEALDKHDRSKAVEILVKDLKVFASFNEELFKEITQLLTLENFRKTSNLLELPSMFIRENEQLSKYGDTKSARAIMLVELKKLIEANPLFRDKLQFPNLKNSRLRTLINQSLNWQHQLCKNPRSNPDIKTLFVDHSCGQQNGARAPSPANNNPLLGGPMPKPGGFPPLGAHVPFQPNPSPVPTPLAGWMSNPPTGTHPAVSGGPIGLGGPPIPGALKHPRTPPTNAVEFSSVDSEHAIKRTRQLGISDEVVNLPVNVLPVSFPGHSHSQPPFNAPDDLPKTVARTLNQGSSPMSMDFHPIQQTLLLVGTNVGDIGLWEVGSRERLVLRNFKVWDVSACTLPLQASLAKDPGVSVNRVIWSPDGSLFGVAYSRHLVQIYSYHGNDDIRQHLEISRLIYTNSGSAILALASNAIHLLWKWQRNDRNSSGKATANVSPQLWQPSSGILMTNDVITESNPEEAVSCFALSKNDSYVMSASGGKISLFNMMTFKTMTTFMPPPPAATFLAFHPQDNNIIAIGMDDSTIQIYNVRVDEVKSKLKGHSKRITGLAFSHVLNVLVSSGADAQICVWNSDGWEKQRSRFLQLPSGRSPGVQSETRVQFHQDQIHFLVVHETQLAIYDTTKLECVKQWAQRENAAPISHATFSCDSQLVYACFLDATVCVFTASHLRLRCRLSDGSVHVFEPLENEGKWGVPPPVENGSSSSVSTTPIGGGGPASEQAQSNAALKKV